MDSHQLAHASFTVSGDRVLPAFWTAYFAVVPDIAHIKGDPVVDRNGEPRNIERRTGVWGIRSNPVIRSDVLEPHLRYLIERLRLPRQDLRERVEREGARMRFFCYWSNESGDRIPQIPEDIRAMMNALGGTIEIDEYR